MERKIVQIAATYSGISENYPDLIALCDDGTLWLTTLAASIRNAEWDQLPPIPQPVPQND